MTIDPQRAQALFLAALELSDSADRRAMLDQECAGNADLRERVEDLLSAHDATGGFGEARSDQEIQPTVEYSENIQPTTIIAGRYKLVEPIGEGGMGTVWLAEQKEPVKRKVAIKLVKPGMDSRAVLGRFEAERQALALMDHPNIARVLDGGVTEQGRPYFAMELVRGIAITDYCDQTQLSIRERLALFEQVCSAVQHAHQKGIIHRDLKPGNILVTEHDARPVVKVIDFGLAKALHGSHTLTDLSINTSFGSVLGTPLYMAPEQLGTSALDVDTRADMYSLGVILYELLTGSTPIERERLKEAAWDEIRRIVRDEEPPRPSTRLSSSDSLPSLAARRHIEPARLTRLVRGELDWIIMKALAKDRNRRYESASSLGQDVQRYLDNEPVQAAPPSRIYWLKKLIRRHRGPVIAASLIFLALVGGIIGTSRGLHLANLAKIEADERRAEADEHRQRAEDREQQAIDAVKRFGDAVADNPELKNDPSLEELRTALLQEPLAFFKTLREQLQADEDTRPESLARLGTASLELVHLTHEIGDKSYALSACQESLAIWQRLVEQNPSVADFRYDLATGHFYLGLLLYETGDHAGVLENDKSAIAILERLVEQNPSVTEFQTLLAKTHKNLGLLLTATGNYVEARESYQSAIAFHERLVENNPFATEFLNNLARCYINLGQLLCATGDPVRGREAYQSAQEIWERLAEQHPSFTEFQHGLAMSHYNLGVMLRLDGDRVGARERYEAAIEIWERLVELSPSNSEYQRALSMGHYILGVLLQLTSDHTGAREAYQSAITIQKRLVEQNPSVNQFQENLARSHNALGATLSDTGDHALAREAYQFAIAIQKRLVEQNPSVADFQSGLGGTLHNIAAVDLGERRFAEARDRLREAIIWQKKAWESNPRNPTIRQFLKNHYSSLQRAAQGLEDADLLAEAQQGLAELQASDPRLQALDNRLAEVLRRDAPKGDAECLALAQHAYNTRRFAAASRLWASALGNDPSLAESRETQHAYSASCAAALAAAGQGIDDTQPDDDSRLRAQALAWLQAELVTWTQFLEAANDEQRTAIIQTLAHWQRDPDLASLRGDAIDSIPESERPAWKQLWSDVAALLARASEARPADSTTIPGTNPD